MVSLALSVIFRVRYNRHYPIIQSARYVQRSTEGHYATQDTSPDARVNREADLADRPVGLGEVRRAPVDTAPESEHPGSEDEGDYGPRGSHTTPVDVPLGNVTLSEDARGIIEKMNDNMSTLR